MRVISWRKNYDANALPVALISLPDQEERRSELARRGMPSEWIEDYFPASDMRRAADVIQNAELASVSKLEGRMCRNILSAEIGCADSHRRAAVWLAQSDSPMMVVMEDDVVPCVADLTAQLSNIGQALLAHAQQGAAFICHLGARPDQADIALKRKVVFRSGSLPLNLPLLYLHADPERTLWRAHAYIISRGTAERVAQQEECILTLADDWCERRRLGLLDEIFYTRPIIVGQDEEVRSTIRPIGYKDCYSSIREEGPFLTRLGGALLDGTFFQRAWASIRFRSIMMLARAKARLPYVLP